MNEEQVIGAALCYFLRSVQKVVEENLPTKRMEVIEVNLPIKKRGIGAGFRNGYGGIIRADESPEYAAIREISEESHSKVYTRDLNPMARLYCHFRPNSVSDSKPYDIRVYWTKLWKDEPEETEEMGKPEWFPIDDLPIKELMPPGRQWLQRFFKDWKPLIVTAYYGLDLLTLDKEVTIEEVSEHREE